MAKLVVGIGNALLRDEGVGCHVVHALEKASIPDTEVIDGGTSMDIPLLSLGADKVIIVDAVKGGGRPGEIYRFDIEDVALENRPFLSLHDMGLVDSLRLVKMLHPVSEVVVVGVEPKEIDWGLELSAELQEKMPQIVDAVLEELNNTNPKGEHRC